MVPFSILLIYSCDETSAAETTIRVSNIQTSNCRVVRDLSMPRIHMEEQNIRDLSASREMLDDFNVQLLEMKRDVRANVP